jgi:flagellar basal body-associated protein FliL
MATVDGSPAGAASVQGRQSAWRSWRTIAILLVILVASAGGAGYWYFYFNPSAGQAKEQPAKQPEPSLPFYLEIKPFVITIVNSAGTPHFVQVGVNLALSGSDAVNAVTAVLPEIQDAMRQTAVAFKVDDIVSPAGIDKLRQAMIADANRVLVQRFGTERANKLSGGEANGAVIRSIYFTTLIVE